MVAASVAFPLRLHQALTLGLAFASPFKERIQQPKYTVPWGHTDIHAFLLVHTGIRMRKDVASNILPTTPRTFRAWACNMF